MHRLQHCPSQCPGGAQTIKDSPGHTTGSAAVVGVKGMQGACNRAHATVVGAFSSTGPTSAPHSSPRCHSCTRSLPMIPHRPQGRSDCSELCRESDGHRPLYAGLGGGQGMPWAPASSCQDHRCGVLRMHLHASSSGPLYRAKGSLKVFTSNMTHRSGDAE
jgi:hypothetical protein